MLADLTRLLTCPVCRDGDLAGLDDGLIDGTVTCGRCGAAYPVRDGVPSLLPPGADVSSIHDELDHHDGHDHKRRQAAYFDRSVAEDFEIERPAGTPAVYRWLIGEKFRRSIEALPSLRDAVVVDVCCGSGMEAEFLARQGARVIAIDISEGCARRARERARRRGLEYLTVVGDVESLPVRSGAADYAYVHDGLHHLDDPRHGIGELARVARQGVSINEPADAFGTQIAVRLGMAANAEAAGNRVARLRASEVARELASAGFTNVRARRYLMYYRHRPGPLMRAASLPVLEALYRGAARLSDAAIGRWGNKLQVTALRES